MNHDKTYWEKRWDNGQTGWDIGYPSPPLTEYLSQINDKNILILIPGSGNAYEAEFAWKNGFKNTFVLDISQKAIDSFLIRFPDFPKENCICEDFFTHQAQYDLILEQTFFCALHPSQRKAYSEKIYELLKNGGKLTGVFFDCEFEGGPPYGGSKEEYLTYFTRFFVIKTFESSYNSIKPREDRELFAILEKR